MIVAAVVCPHPPLLLHELSGAEDAVPALRAACDEALRRGLAAGATSVVVVGGADVPGEWDASLPDVAREFGGAAPRERPGGQPVEGRRLPLSLRVGRRLLRETGWDGPVHLRSVTWEADSGEVEEAARAVLRVAEYAQVEGQPGPSRTLLLVLGDGGARRGDKAPGYLDPRAFAYDDKVEAALRAGDAGALRTLDPVLAADLMVLGRAAFAVLGATVLGAGLTAAAEVVYSDDPYGVQYTVACWRMV